VISIDTNILLYAQNQDCPEHGRAFAFVAESGLRDDVVICELVLVELFVLLRNPAVLERPLPADAAVEVCQVYRRNPRWRLIECAPVMENVWTHAGQPNFARRRIFDARIALTLLHHGVTELATANLKDFDGLGFARLWNPALEGPPAPLQR